MSKQPWESGHADEVRQLLQQLTGQNTADRVSSQVSRTPAAAPLPDTVPLQSAAQPPAAATPAPNTPETDTPVGKDAPQAEAPTAEPSAPDTAQAEIPAEPSETDAARPLTPAAPPTAETTPRDDVQPRHLRLPNPNADDQDRYALRFPDGDDREDEEPEEGSAPDVPLVIPDWDDPAEADAPPEDSNDLPLDEEPPAPATRRNPLRAIGGFFAANFPRKGDPPFEWVRKCVFWVALLVLLGASGYLLYQVWLQPAHNADLYDKVAEEYEPDASGTVDDDHYPAGMLASFRNLYDVNPDVRGFIDYTSTGKKDFLNIHYPVVYSGDNARYLYRDFYGNKNKNGTLFFDERNALEPDNHQNKVLIIYGHNMASGQMFAGLNKLIGNLQNARSAATLILSTLYEKSEYKIFAVVLSDEEAAKSDYFDCRRTYFATDEAFMEHVDGLRARSLFDYPVDVRSDDQLLVLSTCTAYSSAKLHDGRLMVIARRVRADESAAVSTAEILRNEDAIMPRAWYVNQNLELHPYYSDAGYTLPTTTATTTATTLPTVIEPEPTDPDETAPTTTTTTTTKRGTTTTTTTRSATTTPTAPATEPTQPEPTEPEPTQTEPTEPEPTQPEPQPEPTPEQPEQTE